MTDLARIPESSGDGAAGTAENILPSVYDDLRRRAATLLMSESPQTLQATALVHEAWLRLASHGERRWDNRTHFFSAAANMMRRILVDSARRKMRLKPEFARETPDFNSSSCTRRANHGHASHL